MSLASQVIRPTTPPAALSGDDPFATLPGQLDAASVWWLAAAGVVLLAAAAAGAWLWLRRRRRILESRDLADVLQSIPDDDSKPNATTG